MNPRLTKEIRPLLAPSAMIALIMLVPVLLSFLFVGSNMGSFILVSWYAWVIGTGFLAAQAFGIDFQERTMTLLLSQPVPRFSLWRDKLGALLLTVGTLSALYAVCHIFRFYGQESLSVSQVSQGLIRLGGVSICASIITGPFWTGLARSTIGGFVFSSAAQFVAVMFFLALSPGTSDLLDARILHEAAFWMLFGAYTAGFGFWGWRRFSRLQAANVTPVQGDRSASGWSDNPILSGLLAPGRTGRWRNLLRKELSLHGSNFTIAAVFVVLLLVLALVEIITGSSLSTGTLEVLRAIPIVFYPPLIALLTGSMAICEERQLGTLAGSLTQPVRGAQLFLMKLLVSGAVFAGLGLLLPFGLLRLYAGVFPGASATFGLFDGFGQSTFMFDDRTFYPAILCSLFLVSFWASSLFGHVGRVGVLVLGFALMAGTVIVAAWQSAQIYPKAIISPYEPVWGSSVWPTELPYFALWPFKLQIPVFASIALLGIVATAVCRRNFQRVQTGRRQVVRQFLVGLLLIGAVTYGIGYLRFPFVRSSKALFQVQNKFITEIQGALKQLESESSDFDLPGQTERIYTWADLIRTRQISAEIAAKYENPETRFIKSAQNFRDLRTTMLRRWTRFEITPAIHLKEAPFTKAFDVFSWGSSAGGSGTGN